MNNQFLINILTRNTQSKVMPVYVDIDGVRKELGTVFIDKERKEVVLKAYDRTKTRSTG